MQASLEEAKQYFKQKKICLLGLDVDGYPNGMSKFGCLDIQSGNLAVIQKLRFAVSSGKIILPFVIPKIITHNW